jgi:L,D-transpeptidase ErfK/SrfK
MVPADIEALFEIVPQGTPVRIVDQPYKLGWGEGGLYLEAHLPLSMLRETEGETNAEVEANIEANDGWTATELTRLFVAATEERQAQVRWDSAELVMRDARGVPQFVSVPVATAETGGNASSLVVESPLLN